MVGEESLFEPGYNDKILLHEGQQDNWKRYLDDTPRRLAIKKREDSPSQAAPPAESNLRIGIILDTASAYPSQSGRTLQNYHHNGDHQFHTPDAEVQQTYERSSCR